MKRPGSLVRSALPARRKPMAARVASLKPSGPIKARNAKRAKATFERAYGGKRRADWLTSQACVVFGCLGWPTVQAHTSGDNGASYKSSAQYVVPMCAYHHNESHNGVASFERRYMLDLTVEAARTEAAWQSHEAARIAAKARKAAAKQAAAVIPSIAPAPVAGRTAA